VSCVVVEPRHWDKEAQDLIHMFVERWLCVSSSNFGIKNPLHLPIVHFRGGF
jgi:hypothetical protein